MTCGDDNRLNRIEDKIDNLANKQGDMNAILSAQHESLKIHIKRTDLLEKKTDLLQKHVNASNGAWKLLNALALITGIVTGIVLAYKG